MNRTYTRLKAFHIAFIITFVLLIIQYILGMISNLEVQFPGSLPHGNAWEWVWSNSSIIALHIVNGTLLIVVALAAVILSSVARNMAGIVASIIGLAMIVFAWISGAEFLALSQQNTFSLWMSFGFIGAFVAYSVGFYLSRSLRRERSHETETDTGRLILNH